MSDQDWKLEPPRNVTDAGRHAVALVYVGDAAVVGIFPTHDPHGKAIHPWGPDFKAFAVRHYRIGHDLSPSAVVEERHFDTEEEARAFAEDIIIPMRLAWPG